MHAVKDRVVLAAQPELGQWGRVSLRRVTHGGDVRGIVDQLEHVVGGGVRRLDGHAGTGHNVEVPSQRHGELEPTRRHRMGDPHVVLQQGITPGDQDRLAHG